jgi:hypothetical protein
MSYTKAKYRITLTPTVIDAASTCVWKVERWVRVVPGWWIKEDVAHGSNNTEEAAENVARARVEDDREKLTDRRVARTRERIIELPS